tara:strand:- start:1869 stop:3161 length:1293 start_codon:yes stop_codon:yes gene_type:complete
MAILRNNSQIAGITLSADGNSAGLVVNKVTNTEMGQISSPTKGAIIYNTTDNQFYRYTGNAWSSQQGGQGAIGATGPQGDKGPTGVQGAQGNQGPQGVQGAIGVQGATGPANNQGGAQGPKGPKGPDGAAGHQGFQGSKGPTGNQGAQGPRNGPKGPTGNQGVQGATGPANNQGGSQGATGPANNQGGSAGAKGPQGVQGAQGNKGPTGATGNQGPGGGGGNQGPRGVSQPSNNLGTAPQGSYVNFARVGLNVGPQNQGVDARGGNNAAIFSSNNSNSGGGWRQYVNSNPYSWQFRGDQNPGVTLHYWKSNGQFYHKGNISSDQNLKKEITPYTASVLETKLGAKHRASSFIMIGNEVSKSEWTASSTDKAEIGFIAQHYTASAPEVVDMVDTGSLGIQERGVTAMLTKAFQEISESLTNLNNRIKTLEG